MNQRDALLTLLSAITTITVCFISLKEFRLACFDRDFAAANGWPLSAIDCVIMGLVVLITVVGLQSVGILLIVALLVIPPAGARFWTNRLTYLLLIAGSIGGLSGYVGSVASALLPRIPAGAVIVLVAGFAFFASMLIAPCRGLIGIAVTHLRVRLRISEDHLLRSLHEQRARQLRVNAASEVILMSGLAVIRQWSPLIRSVFLLWIQYRGWIRWVQTVGQNGIILTDLGQEEAHIRVRNHRLWEEYLTTCADAASMHIDYAADFVEHYLSPEIISQVEESLRDRSDSVGEVRSARNEAQRHKDDIK